MKKYTKRIVAFVLTLAMLACDIPFYATATTGDTIVYDFGRPTTGLEVDGTITGMDNTAVAASGRITTSFAGTNWVINNDKTTAPKTAEDETIYQRLQTNSTNTQGLVLAKWAANAMTYLQANFNHTIAFDINVPEAGIYALTVANNDRNIAMPIDVTVNGTYLAQVPTGTATGNVETTTELGQVALQAGINTVEFKHVGTTTAQKRNSFMLRSLTITKVADSATPTQAPAPTLAPTQAPTLAPTQAPTQTPAASGTTFTIDFLNSTAGASLNGVVGGVNLDTAQKGGYLVTTSFAGNGWRINTTETNVTLNSDGTTYYNDEFLLYYKTIKGVESAMAFRRYKYVAFDFTVPEAGVYEVIAKFEPYGNTGLTDWYVNDKSTRLNRTAAGLTGDTSVGQVTLNAGEYANTIWIRNQGSGTHTYLQSVTFKKVADAPQITPTPVATSAPTATPGPTLAPTLAPSPTPIPTPAPTLDPNATQAPFSVSVTTADNNTIYTADGERFYMTKDTKGANWKVDASTDEKNLVQGTTIAAANRFYYSGSTPNYLQVYASGMTVLRFTAPQGGDYDLSSMVKFATTGGYGDIYVNGNYVGTIDSNYGENFHEQKLLGVTLYAGEYANTISFKQAGRSTGTNSYLYLQSFDFTPVANKAKKTGLEIQIDSTQLYVGDEKQVTTVGKTTNGAFYRLASVGVKDITYTSSDNSVATISTGGLVKALKAGTTTITAHSASLNETGTITLNVSDVAFAEAEVNVEDGALIVARDTITLEAKAKFNNGEYAPQKDITVVYESDDEDVFKIEDGILVAVGEGTAKLTAKVTYKGVTHNAVRTINVLKYEPPQAFKFDFATADKLITRADGQAWYMSKETHGDLWRVDAAETTKGTIGTDPDNLGVLRFFMEEKYSYFRPMSSGKEYVFEFTAPIPGTYDITAYAVAYNGGGYGDIYINDVYVGSVDCYTPETALVPFNLLGVKLKPGEYANEFRFVPTGEKSSASSTNTYTAISRLDFTPTETPATLVGVEASADVSAMYVGREEQISVDAILSNGGLYRLNKCEETLKYETSDANIATVSNTGKITAKGAGEVTITVTTSETNLSDTITFHVTDAAYDKAVVNITEGEEFYVTNERALSVVATLTDGTEIAQKDLIITYTSSNPDVAKVEDNVLKIVAKGNATITADVKFRVTGETKSDVKNISATTIPLKGITAATEKTTVQALDKDGVKLIVKGIAYDDTIVEDLVLAGFTSFDYTFTALTPDKLTIDPDGTCHYVSRGDAQIKVEAVIDGVPFECVADVVSSSSKTGRTLYTDEMIAAAQYNANNFKWGKSQVQRTEGQVYRYTFYTEQYYDAIPAEGVPRSGSTGTINASNVIKQCCPYCGINVEQTFGQMKWITDPINSPWKIECPNCYMKFPSNDFELLYKRGLDENGNYNRELAYQRNAEAVARGEKDALVNELYPDKGPTWYVDDGFGYSPAEGTYGTTDTNQFTAVAFYHHLFWYKAPVYHLYFVLYKLRDAYLWTGNEVYGRAGAILLDRVADVYPDYDITKVGLGYGKSDGGRNSGKILGCIWEYYIAEYFVDCYDAFYPMYDDPEVIEFLSRKSQELGLENPKNTPDLIRENIENGIVRESLKACYNGDIWGNFGMQQIVAAKAAVVLDTYPETQEALDWLEAPSTRTRERVQDPVFDTPHDSDCANGGGELGVKYIQEIDRDGFGGEISISYNSIWLEQSIGVANVLNRYGADLDLYKDPKFVKMFKTFIYMTLGDGYSLANGDSGETAGAGVVNFATQILQGYDVLRDPELAQIYDYYVGGNYSNAYIDMYTNPTDLIVSIQNDVKEYGKLELESLNLTGYGLAVLRGGKAATKSDQFERRYDTWMYYGRTAHSHAHNDMLQLGIDAYGFNFSPDLGYPEATASTSNRYEWVKNSISHNVVLVDEKEQDGIYTGNPLHFDSTENVKLMDVEANNVYEQTDIYRRTAVTIKYNDDVSYTLDFFRVRGGNNHMYSFHTSSYNGVRSEDIEFTPQMNEKGEYVGTYAGPDVPYGPDPNSTDAQYAANPVYPRGYTWLTHVNRGVDKTNDGYFVVNFAQTDFKDQVVDSNQLHLNFHSVNDWTPSKVDVVMGYAPRIAKNERVPGLDYMFIHRTGENLDTLFTSVWEPYKGDSYIQETSEVVPTVKSGTETADDVVKVVKVLMKNGRADYIVYATNNDVLYNITDGNVSFDFQGFVGVYTVDYFGNNTYKYINDGTVIGDATSMEAYTGTVMDFTKDLVFENSITIKMNETVEDVSVLNNQYIYIDNTSELTGAFRILEAEKDGENIILHLGNTSIIEDFIDAYDTDGGYTYIIAEGQSFRIPLSMADDTVFSGTNAPAPSGGGSGEGSSSDSATPETDADTSDDAATSEEMTEFPTAADEDDEKSYIILDEVPAEPSADLELEATPAPSTEGEGAGTTEGADGEPTATPDATNTNAGSKTTRNILLGGLGILALIAGIFLILLGKKKDEDEE